MDDGNSHDHDHRLPPEQLDLIRRLTEEKCVNHLLDHLSELLFQDDSLCSAVAACFRPLLLQLLVTGCRKASPEQKFVTLSHLIGFHDVATQFAHSLIADSSLMLPVLSGKRACDQIRCLKACLTFLWCDHNFCIKAFDWSPVLELVNSPDPCVAWLATQCVNVISGSSLHDAGQKLTSRFPAVDFDSFRLQFHEIFGGRAPDDTECDLVTGIMSILQPSHLSDEVVSVNGVLLSRVKPLHASPAADCIVVTDRFQKGLTQLARHVQSSTPVIVTGPVGCGKTSLIEHLAHLTGRNGSPFLTKVQLGDQIDGKLLIGGYFATEVPGQFIWRPGPLTTAMLNGHWILFEDMDSAAPDVISLLMTALKTFSLSSLPGSNVAAARNGYFRMFFTVRSDLDSVRHLPFETTRVCSIIEMEAPDDAELADIISKGFPKLEPLKPAIVGTYRLAAESLPGCTDSRPVTLRDMVKWVRRIDMYYPQTSHYATKSIFKDAIDCFVPNPATQSDKVQVLGTYLNISKPDCLILTLNETPCPLISGDEFRIGRVSLKIKQQDLLSPNRHQGHQSFAFTRQSLRLLEQIAAAVHANEPILLVGETGTGKTSTVQFLAHEIGQKLVVVNLNQQTDTCDLIGGYKPSDLTVTLLPLVQSFAKLVLESFPNKVKNAVFVQKVADYLRGKKYETVCDLIFSVHSKVRSDLDACLKKQWDELIARVTLLADQVKQSTGKSVMVFAFIEGSLVKAMREGHWILLDEINLAEADTLQSLCHVLDSNDPTVVLIDKADGTPVLKHEQFRIFACMNPATDIGKKDLPLGVRNRFTEFHVNELQDERDLRILVEKYLPACKKTESIIQFYIEARNKCLTLLTDTCGHRPHFSLRTLCRALTVAASNPCQDVNRSLYEAFCLSFLTQLNTFSKSFVTEMIGKYMIGDSKSVKACLGKVISAPSVEHIFFEGYWLPPGPCLPESCSRYILTQSVQKNIADLVRVVSLGKTTPVLLQGETSVGKTSLIQWLAKASGNICRRLNNHEHTDLEEYVGSYGSDVNGHLVFREGVLVEAMRKGHWIILDELNLAPTEVLEALNRVLDENREIFIPETQVTVKAHPNFVLFATQNPPGLYAGRKILSRAFRNRFVELHFDEIPANELIVILEKRCLIPASYAKKMVLTMSELQRNRRGSEIFAGKSGFITLRDLFRWGDRFRVASESIQAAFFDWDLFLAEMGFMVLAARVRKQEEEDLVREALQKRFLKNKQTLEVTEMYHKLFHETFSCNSPPEPFGHIVATDSLRRLVALVWSALKFREPVLLVGETGCGKTSICQLYALLSGRDLKTVNCHMHSESSDFLGNLRPVRNPEKGGPLFHWVDGPLVDALEQGCVFLLDEISLADDSVLERLNSVLEPERTLMLSEKGLDDSNPDSLTIRAHESFRFVSTMNPGGDYGKKELSPALRNRFTEIWCPSTTSEDDMERIIKHNLQRHLTQFSKQVSSIITRFFFWLKDKLPVSSVCSVRDILTWLNFVNCVTRDSADGTSLSVQDALVHGAHLVFIDALGCGGFSGSQDASQSSLLRIESANMIRSLTKPLFEAGNMLCDHLSVEIEPRTFRIGHFAIARLSTAGVSDRFTFETNGVRVNAMKVMRGMQLQKPILLEGPPGVGKTSLVVALADHTGHKVVRINLSEQTDISDLFGSDLPVEGEAGRFEWRDGPLLQALKSRDTWIILDEMNLASQSVLEGLNACLDHRGEIFVAELGKTFSVNKNNTRIFGCQNPYREGGDRKGLPRSFLNRFTVVFIDSFCEEDLVETTAQMFPQIESPMLKKIVHFNQQLSSSAISRQFSGPEWEMNLRDIFRCCSLISSSDPNDNVVLADAIQLIYCDRMRCHSDRETVHSVYGNVFGHNFGKCFPDLIVTPESLHAGSIILKRIPSSPPAEKLILKSNQIPCFSSLMKCVANNWLAIIVSNSVEEASDIVHALASLSGNILKSQTVNMQTDAIELLGGFEQKDLSRRLQKIESVAWRKIQQGIRSSDQQTACRMLCVWDNYCKLTSAEGFSEKDILLTRLRRIESVFREPPAHLDMINEIRNVIQSLSLMKDVRCAGSFEWQDSQLISAVQNGHWLLIEDANTCSPSVLDRLNPLFEPSGRIIMTEQGSVDGAMRVIEPHPNFRFFMTMNPANGELSRPMRNRGVEIFLQTVSEQPCLMDVNAVIADPVVAKVTKFPTDVLSEPEFSRSKFLQQVICRLFLQSCSLLDFEMRVKNVNNFRVTANTSPQSLSDERFPGHPIDRRHLMFHQMDDKQVRAVNKWLLALFREFHPSLLNLDAETRIVSLLPTDEQYFVLRLFSQITIAPAASKHLVKVIKSKFLSRIAAAIETICPPEDADVLKIDKWIELVQQFSSDVCLTRNEDRSLDAHDALKLVGFWDRIEDHSPAKLGLSIKLAELFLLISSSDSDSEEISESASEIGKAMEESIAEIPHYRDQLYSSVFSVVFVLFERQAVARNVLTKFFNDSVLRDKLVSKVSIHPLHRFYGQKESCTTEHVLHHLRYSQNIRKLLNTKKTRLHSNESPNLTSVLTNSLSHKDATLKSAQHLVATLSDLKDLLLISLLAGDSFDASVSSVNIAEQWLKKLQNAGAVAPAELPFEMIWASREFAISADHDSDPLLADIAAAAFILQVGLSSAQIFAPILLVDPMEVREQELIHLETQYDLISTELLVTNTIASFERGDDYNTFSNVHPHIKLLQEHGEMLAHEIRKQKQFLVHRPKIYDRLRNSVATFQKNILSHLVEEMSQALPAIMTNSRLDQKMLKKWDTTRSSIANYSNKTMSEYLDYWDILSPFVTSLFLIENGMQSLSQFVDFGRDAAQVNRLKLVRSFASSCCNYFDPDLLKTIRFLEHFESDLTILCNAPGQSSIASKLRIAALMDARNFLSLNKTPDPDLIITCVKILEHFVKDWVKHEAEDEAEKRKREATIICQTFEGEAVDQELEQQELARTFPTFTGSFADLDIHHEEASDSTPLPEQSVSSQVKEVRLLVSLHHQILQPDDHVDLFTPFNLKYEILSLLTASSPSLIAKLNHTNLLSLHLLAVRNNIDQIVKSGSSSDPAFDIYHDFDKHEVEKCRKILTQFKDSIELILVSCPEHPTLVRLLTVIDRMFEFEVSSPLVRFLTGMELLLEQAQEWQKVYASSQHKITQHLELITSLIITWRKLEMNHWSNCLDMVSRKVSDRDEHQWWFDLFRLVHEFEGNSADDVTETMKQFIESSSIGQFSTRLQLLRLFSAHVCAVRGNPVLLNILHNMEDFYRQFAARVASIHDASRKPIEKDVKDFVRVQQWKDMNYWSLKKSIDKSHKFLLRQMKKYESSLAMPVTPHLIIPEQNSQTPSPKPLLAVTDYLIPFDVREEDLNHLLNFSEKPDLLIKNVRRFSRKVMESCAGIRDQIEDEDESISSLIHEVHELQNLKLDPSLTNPDDRKKAIHHMNNRKRKSLSNLFKFLAHEGLSWTEGLRHFQSFSVNEAFSSMPRVTTNSGDDSCNKYFFSSLARLAQLRSSLKQPCKDLSAADLDRIRGFAGHMIHLLVHHRKTLSLHSQALIQCENQMMNLRSQMNQASETSISFKILLTKLEYLIHDEIEVPANVFLSEGVDVSQMRSIISRALNSDLSIEFVSDVLEQLLSLMPDGNLMGDEIRRLLTCCSEQRGKESCSDARMTCNALGNVTLCSLRALQNMVALMKPDAELNENLAELLHYDRIWNSLNISESADLLLNDVTASGTSGPVSDASCQIINQYLRVCRFIATLAMEAHRVFGKMLHVLLGIFVKLTQEGYCLPPESPPEETASEGTDQLTGTGMADGQGGEDVSDRITSEDQLEDALQDGDENADQNEEVGEESGGIEMESEFDGKDYDADGNDSESDEDDSDEELSADDKMGDVDGDKQPLDKMLWENEDSDGESGDADDGGKGDESGERQITAADDQEKDPMDSEKEGADMSHEKDGDCPENESQFDDEYEGEQPHPPELPEESLHTGKEDADMNLPEDMDLDADQSLEGEDSETESAKAEAKPDDDDAADLDDESMTGDPHENAGIEENDENVSEQLANEQPEVTQFDAHDEEKAVPTNDTLSARDRVMDEEQSHENAVDPTDRHEEHGAGDGPVGEDSDGHEGYQPTPAAGQETGRSLTKRDPDSSRSLSEELDRPAKRQRIIPSEREEKKPQTGDDVHACGLVQHVRDGEHGDERAIDQADRNDALRSRPNEEHEADVPKPDADENFLNQNLLQDNELKSGDPRLCPLRQPKQRKDISMDVNDEVADDPATADDGDLITTETVPRGPESRYHTKPELLSKSGTRDWMTVLEKVTKHRSDGQQTLEDASLLWAECSRSVSSLLYELCQQLQLVLEPSKCSKLKGDYRTGKRINMRKVVAYIASQFRKDKIWLRRTKPSKRMYQIVLAVDDSRSMLDNETKLLAFQSLALLSKSLSLIEAGQLAVLSFGEQVKLLHSLDEPFSEDIGPRLLTHFSFDQKQTRVASLISTTCDLFLQSKRAAVRSDVSQLLLIISDGRGLFNDGRDMLTTMVRRLNDSGVFCVFVILDNPQNNQSIFDITSVDFKDGKAVKRNYMDDFPFPFYIVLRDIRNMPVVLGESLRQWFELVSSTK